MPKIPSTLSIRPENLLLTQLTRLLHALEMPFLIPFTIFRPMLRNVDAASEKTPLILPQIPEKNDVTPFHADCTAEAADRKNPPKTEDTDEKIPCIPDQIPEKNAVTPDQAD